MKLSSQEEYGLRCLLRIGARGDGGTLTIPEISRAEGISPEYVAKLMRILRRGGLVTSARGAAGGYTLSRPADQITADCSNPTSVIAIQALRACARIRLTARYARCGAHCRMQWIRCLRE